MKDPANADASQSSQLIGVPVDPVVDGGGWHGAPEGRRN